MHILLDEYKHIRLDLFQIEVPGARQGRDGNRPTDTARRAARLEGEIGLRRKAAK